MELDHPELEAAVEDSDGYGNVDSDSDGAELKILKRLSLKHIEIEDSKISGRVASEKELAAKLSETKMKGFDWAFLKSMAFAAGLVLYCIHFMMFTQAILIEHKPWREYSTRMVQKYFPESFLNAWILFLDGSETIQNFIRFISPRFPLVKIPEKNIIVRTIKMIVEWIFQWFGYFSIKM